MIVRVGTRSALAAAAGCGSLLLAAPAAAHDPADIALVAPAEGTSVTSPVRLVLAGGGARREPATFSLTVDGSDVDVFGRSGAQAGIFRSHRIASGQTTELTLALGVGEHEVRASYAADADSAPPDVVRRFRVVTAGRGATGVVALSAAAVAVATAAGRRRASLTATGGAR